MDGQRLETLSRRIAAAPSRRAVMGLLAGGLLLGRAAPDAAAAEKAFGLCRIPGDTCGDDTQCCSGRCREGVCGCKKRGKRAIIAALCCSGKKKKGSKGECA